MVSVRVPPTPRKKAGSGFPPPRCRVPMVGHNQCPRAPSHDATHQAVSAVQLFVHSSFVLRSPPPHPVLKPIQVAEISSEQMEEEIKVVEELSRPQEPESLLLLPSPPTLPGDITSSNNEIPTEWRISPMCVLDLSEEMDKLAVIHRML